MTDEEHFDSSSGSDVGKSDACPFRAQFLRRLFYGPLIVVSLI